MKKVITFVIICAIVFGVFFYDLYTKGMIYDPFGGVYLYVTDCSKPYITGQGSFSGPYTDYKRSLIKIADVNWYLDNVKQIAPFLWSIKGQLYDDAFLIYQENDIDRTTRIVNQIDASSVELLQDSYYGDVGLRDKDKDYILHGWGWRGLAKVPHQACGYENSTVPRVIPGSNHEFTAEDVRDLTELQLVELSEPFYYRSSPSLKGYFTGHSSFGSSFLIINNSLYYQKTDASPVMNLGVVEAVNSIGRLYPKNGPNEVEIVGVDDKIFANDRQLDGTPDTFSLVQMQEESKKHPTHSENFFKIADRVYFVERDVAENTGEVILTDIPANVFKKVDRSHYTDGVFGYFASNHGYKTMKLDDLHPEPCFDRHLANDPGYCVFFDNYE